MGYDSDSRLAATTSTTTHGRFLEGVASVYVSPDEIQRQTARTREVIHRLYAMDDISRRAGLERQTYGDRMKAQASAQCAQQEVQEPVMAY